MNCRVIPGGRPFASRVAVVWCVGLLLLLGLVLTWTLLASHAWSATAGPATTTAETRNYDERSQGYDSLAAPTTPGTNTRVDATRGEHQTGGASRASTSLVALRRAPKAAGTATRGGESGATAFGRQVHREYNYGPGFRKEFTLGSGRRPDAINFRTREVVELKPNNPAGIRRGQRQLEVYQRDLQQQFPGQPWSTRIETYDPYRGQ